MTLVKATTGSRPQLAVLAVLVAAAAAIVPTWATTDLPADTASALAGLWVRMAALTWLTVACLVATAVLHCAAAATATRLAAGVRLPFGEMVAVQLAASTANRLTPAGLGGAIVTGRYFSRRGRLQVVQAVAAVSTLTLLGSVADVLAFAGIIGLGTLAGLAGASGELPLLASKLGGVLPVPAGWWLWGAAGAGALVVAAAATPRCRNSERVGRIAGAMRTYRTSVGALARRPRRLLALLGASAATTLSLAAGFAAVATLGAAGLPARGFCALMIGYMIAAAAGNALPTPGGIGTTDAALVGVLVAARMPATNAIAVVISFRLITFWAPAVIGLGAARTLRRRGAL